MTALRFGSVLLSWLILASLAQAAMYKWVDDQGVTRYSQHPPSDRPAETLVPPPRPNTDAAAAQKKLEETLQDLDEDRKGRAETEQEQQKLAATAEHRRKTCTAARDNLTKLTTGGRKRLIGPDGVAAYMTDEDRQARIDKAQKQIEEFCD